jgi:hypothetical protein
MPAVLPAPAIHTAAGPDVHAAGLHLPADEREDLRKPVLPSQESIQANARQRSCGRNAVMNDHLTEARNLISGFMLHF